MHSIGGGGKRVPEIVDSKVVGKRLFLEQLAEVSYVDNGACPTAKFEIVKSVDGHLVDAEPADEPEPIAKIDAALDAALEVEKAAKKDDGEKNKTADGKEGKEYAGTDGKSFPIAEPKDVANAARALGRTDQDKAKVKANIIRIAYKLGAKYVDELPEAWKKKDDQKAEKLAAPAARVMVAGDETLAARVAKFLGPDRAADVDAVVKAGMEPWDIDNALGLISGIERLMSNEFWEAQMAAAQDGNTDGPEVAQVKLLKQAAQLLLQFLMSEWEEQFEPSQPNAPLDLGLDDDDVVEMFVKSLAVVQKAGKRHSAKDQEMVQKIHDVSTSLGGVCKDMGDDDAEKVLKFVQGEKVAEILKGAGYLSPEKTTLPISEPTEAITKITAELETAKAALTESQATVAKQAETVAALDTRLKALEDLPAGGGPVRNAQAVDKALGGPSGEEGASGASVVKALQAVANESTDPAVKAAIAMQIVKLSHTNQIALSPR
jgi:hypothetical protein